MAALGHKVTLLDISQENLKFAQAKAKEQGVRFEECVCASATDMSMFEDDSLDAVLLMGPLCLKETMVFPSHTLQLHAII